MISCYDSATTIRHSLSLHDALPIFDAYRQSRSAFVSISDSDRVPGLEYLATVHHGIDSSRWPIVVDPGEGLVALDRKSTRLNSSHLVISYAVFCLIKKTMIR